MQNYDSRLTIYLQAERDPDEEGDYMAFEQLMAESMRKQDKKKDKEKEKEKSKNHEGGHHFFPHGQHAHAADHKPSH